VSATILPRVAAPPVHKASSFRKWTERETVFSWLMIIPPAIFLILLVGYPFVYGIWLSLENRPVAKAGTFVGLANFIADMRDPVFWQVTQNTFVYTFFATILKMIGGLGLALVMNQAFRFKNMVRAIMLLPFIVPTVLSTIAWMWILDPAFAPAVSVKQVAARNLQRSAYAGSRFSTVRTSDEG